MPGPDRASPAGRPLSLNWPIFEDERPLVTGTCHLARRTFAGNIYRQVKDPNLVASLTGHAEGSRAFNRYREIDLGMKQELVKILENKKV